MFMHLKDGSGYDVYPNIYEIEAIFEYVTQGTKERDPARSKIRMKSGKEFTIPQSAERVLAAVNTVMEGTT